MTSFLCGLMNSKVLRLNLRQKIIIKLYEKWLEQLQLKIRKIRRNSSNEDMQYVLMTPRLCDQEGLQKQYYRHIEGYFVSKGEKIESSLLI